MNNHRCCLILCFLLLFPFGNKGRVWHLSAYDITDGTDQYRSKVIELCEEYVQSSEKFTYGGNHAAFRRDNKNVDGKYEINCSTFSLLIALGVRFNDSKYEGGDNHGMFRSEYTDSLIRWFSDGGQEDRNIKYSRDLAKKLFEDGYGMIPDEDLSDIDTGDILFFNLDTSNDRPGIDFMGVDHSAIFGYKFGDKYIIYEVGDNKGPKCVLKTKESMGKVVMVGKLPNRIVSYTKRIVLATNEERKSLNKTADGKNDYKIADVSLDNPLKKGKCYTIVVDAIVGDGVWLNATYNGTSSYAFNLTNVRDYRPTGGIYRIHFIAPEDIYTLSLNIRSNLVRHISANYNSCILFDGIVTDNK